jgi:hypothetical protein
MGIDEESSERWIPIEPAVEDFGHHLFTELKEPALTRDDAIGTAVEAKSLFKSDEIASIDPVAEDAYWREHYKKQPYYHYRPGRWYFDYQPAYRYRWERALDRKFRNKRFDEVEEELPRGWAVGVGLRWQDWREIVRDAWNRVRREA